MSSSKGWMQAPDRGPETGLRGAAIFDLDGLLIDSEPLWQQAEVEGFGAVGVPLTRQQAAETLGVRSDEVVQRRFRQYGWDARLHPPEQVEDDIIRRVIELIRARGRAQEGVDHALDFMARKGLRLALASSSRMRVIHAALEVLDLTECFEVVYSAELEPHGKPHPGVYLSTARRLGLAPERCLAVEDSVAGLQAAKAAGMSCLVVPNPSIRDDARLAEADVVLPSLAAIDEEAWRRLTDWPGGRSG